jgi:Staphylococcal nuclease homologue
MTHNATNLILMTSIEVTDRYGRLIGYINRKETEKTGAVLKETLIFENSFNIRMMQTGYAFMYLLYPNLVIEKKEKAKTLTGISTLGIDINDKPQISKNLSLGHSQDIQESCIFWERAFSNKKIYRSYRCS